MVRNMIGHAGRLVHGVFWFTVGLSAGALYMFFLLGPSLPLMFTIPPLRKPAMKLYRWWTGFLIGNWFTLLLAELEFVAGLNFKIYGLDSLPSNEDALIISNHRCCVDWLFLHGIGLRTGKHSQYKIVCKDQLKPLIVFGWAMQMGLFIFMKRNNVTEDLDYMKKMLNYIRLSPNGPGLIAMFPEGTDLNPISKASSDKYAEKKSLPQTHYTMYPRVRGFSQAVALLSDTETKGKGIDAVYNVTMAYDDFAKGERSYELSFLRGRFPIGVHILVSRIPVNKIAEIIQSNNDEIKYETWLRKEFALKEEVLKKFYEQTDNEHSGFSEPECITADQHATAMIGMKRAIYIFIITLICAVFLLQFRAVRWYTVFLSCIFTLFTSVGGGLEALEANIDEFFRSMEWNQKKNV